MITPAQIRDARALLNWRQSDLAKRAGLSLRALNNIEKGITDPRVSTMQAIELALTAAGVEFIPDGVRLPKAGTLPPERWLVSGQ